MGPLVPDIIGNELNLVVALFIGILFGVILEQAGFSTTKKLVGLFYGYDFTVLRVFFTAGTVAMIGVIALDYFGYLDLSLIYINPTFLWSALVGGAIMGLGFVIGGFCPGTSVCAAAIGKLDAMIFLVGTVLGILVFTEGYPLFEGLYKAEFLGYPQIYDTLGISRQLFAFLLAAVALAAFWAVTKIEHKVNGTEPKKLNFNMSLAFVSVLVLIALVATNLPERKSSILQAATTKAENETLSLKSIPPDKLAFLLLNQDEHLQIFDFRSPDEFKTLSLPHSVLFTSDNLFEKNAHKWLAVRGKKNVFVSQDGEKARKMAFVAKKLGFHNIQVLEGGFQNFKSEILDFRPTPKSKAGLNDFTIKFRTKASVVLPQLIEAEKNAVQIKPKKQKRVLGGC